MIQQAWREFAYVLTSFWGVGGRVNRIGVNVIGWLVALVFYPYFFFIRYVYGLGWGFIPIYSGRILDG